MTKLTSPPTPLKYGDFVAFLSQKNSFVHTDDSPLSFLWSPIDKKNGYQKKSPEIW
jgi:hypothetical protein